MPTVQLIVGDEVVELDEYEGMQQESVYDEIDECECVDMVDDDELLVSAMHVHETENHDDETELTVILEIHQRQTVDDDEVEPLLLPVLESELVEQQMYVMLVIEAGESIMLHDEILVMCVNECVCIDLQVMVHLLL